jgi:hypothetical protein
MTNETPKQTTKKDESTSHLPLYFKLAFIGLALLSMFGTYWFAKQSFNVQCGFSGKTYGYAMSKAKCHELSQYFQDSLELANREQERVANNQAALEELDN